MTAVALALGGVLLAIAIGFVMLRLARGGDVQVRLGSDTWNVGKASRLAPAIAEGGPMMFSDVAGGSRDLYVSHTGDDAQQGWVAFAARPAGASRSCYVQWQKQRQSLVDNCTGTTFPIEGTGLEQFPVRVQDGQIIVDINHVAERSAQSSSTTTSSIVQSGIPRTTTTK
jgi:hypothetical protein